MSRTTRSLLAWLLLAAGTLFVAATANRAAGAADSLTAGERQGAETLYANSCATCHGSAGTGGVIPGTDRTAPPLVDIDVAYLDLTMRVGRMPPPENEPFDNRARNVVLTDEQRTAVVAYLTERFDLEGAVPDPPPGDARAGREVYAANCAQCHGSTGAGGVAGAGAWTPPVVDRGEVAVAEATRVGPFEMPAFGAEQISDQEIGDVAAFLAFVAEERGTPLGLVEINPVYASGFAFVFAMIVLLSALWIAGRPTHFPDPELRPPGEAEDRG